MGEAYLGEIFMGGWNFAPRGFDFCSGQLLAISQNSALFSLLGTNFGGDGQQTFGLPDLRGRVPMHWGQGPGLSTYNIGQTGGTETVTLLTSQIPAHSHAVNANSNVPTTGNPANSNFSGGPLTGSGPNASQLKLYTNQPPNGAVFNANTIGAAGGSQPHPNIQPFQCITFVIALQGIFPSRN